MGFDFAEGVDPVQFILRCEKGFYHNMAQYCAMYGMRIDPGGALPLIDECGHDLNNFFLILASIGGGRMPDYDSAVLLGKLVGRMRFFVRETVTGSQPTTLPKEHAAKIVDEILLDYQRLAEHLKANPDSI